MRFCMVTTFYPPYHFGGDAVFVRALARALVSRGHQVEVVHCEDAYRLQARARPAHEGIDTREGDADRRARRRPDGRRSDDDGVVVHRLRGAVPWLASLITQQSGRPGLYHTGLRTVLDRGFDVVNFHNISLAGGPAVLTMSRAPVTLYTLHEHWLLCPTHVFWKNRQQACDKPECFQCCVQSGIPPQLWRYTDLIRTSLQHVDALIAPSRYTAERHEAAHFGRPIHVLPSFSTIEPETRQCRSAASRPRFLYVGRMTASKGIAGLLREFATLPEYDLVVAGDGDLRRRLEHEYARHPHIRVVGACAPPQLASLYREATALLVPSLAPEVFPLTILEAFAFGTPAIVHDIGGAAEAVQTTGGGIVYRDAAGLRNAVTTLAQDPALRDTLGARARAGYDTYYSEQHYMRRYLGLIEAIRRSEPDSRHSTEPASTARSGQRGLVRSGPRAHLGLGHLPEFLSDRLGFLSECAARYGPVVELRIGGPTFLLNDPDDVRHVLVTNAANYDKTPRMTSRRGRWLSGNGLLTSSGAVHLRQRRLLQPALSRKSVESFAGTMVEAAKQVAGRWTASVELDVTREMMALAQRILVLALLGDGFTDERGRLADAINARRRYMEQVFFSLLPLPECLPTRVTWHYARTMRHLRRLIDAGIRARRQRPTECADLLSLLVQARYDDGTGMTDRQIHDEALTLMVTGHETMGEALAWTWYLIARHPDVEARLLAHVDEVLGAADATAADLPRLGYASMVLAESMRLYPPTWLFVRMARSADTLPTGVRIAAGSKLYLSPYVMHRNPRYFPEPERFDPERFSAEQRAARPQFAYFPFGGGPRVCIGEAFARMEGVLVLATLAQRARLTLSPGQTVVPEPRMTLRARNGISMMAHPRTRSART